MKTASAIYKMLRALDNSWYEVQITQGNKVYGLDKLKSVKVHQSIASGKGLSIGGANAAECRITLDEQSANWARMAQFTLQVRICAATGSTKSEWITIGTFYTDERSEDKYGNLSIVGYDGMLLTEQYWTDKIPSSSLPASFPITARAFAQMVQSAGLCTFEDLSKLDDTVAFIGLDTVSTVRDKLKDIAAAHGGNWQITPTGALQLVNYRMVENSLAIAGIAIAGIAIVGASDASSLPSSKFVQLGLGMKMLDKSPALAAVSGVTLETAEGETASAGTDSQYIVKGKCNFSSSDGVAALSLSRLQNYSYKPFTFKTVDLDPIVDIGDIVIADDDGYQIMDINWTFGKRPYADMSAPYDEEVDHEYTIVNPEAKTYRKSLAEMEKTEERVNSRIQQTATSITTEVSRTYETKTDASGKLTTAKSYADSQIQQTAESIKSTVSASQKQYDLESYTVTLYGYGAPSSEQYPPASYNNTYYLNQSNGALYRSNGSAWSKVKDLTLITASQQTQITQNATAISAKVSKTGGSNNTFGWNMTDTSQTWYANSQEIMKLSQAGLVIKGEIRATTGFIGDGTNGFNISSTGIYKGMTSFSDTQHNGVYIGADGISLGGGKFKVDMYGNLTATSGTFTSSVYAKDIIVGRQSDGTDAGYISSGQIGTGQVTGGSNGNIGTYTIGDVNVGSHELTTGAMDVDIGTSLGYADFFNDSTSSSPSRYPDYFTASRLIAITSVRAPKFLVPAELPGESDLNLHKHYHSVLVNSDGSVEIGAPVNTKPDPFNIADTQIYKTNVLASRAVLYCNATNYTDVTSGYDCDLTGSSYHYTPSSGNVSYGRIELRNSYGNKLKTLRVKFPATASHSVAVSVSGAMSSSATNHGVITATGSCGGSSASGTYDIYMGVIENSSSKVEMEVYHGSGSNKVTLAKRSVTPQGGSSTIASIVSASTDSDYSDYYQSGGRWKLYVHAKDSSGNVIFTDTIDIQRAVDWGAAQGGATGHVEVTSTSGNSAFVKLYNSSWGAIPINGSSVGRWIDAGTSYPFG